MTQLFEHEARESFVNAYPESAQLQVELQDLVNRHVDADAEIKVSSLLKAIAGNFLELEHDVIGECIETYDQMMAEATAEAAGVGGDPEEMARQIKKRFMLKMCRFFVVDTLTSAFLALDDE